ncbi:hypothetical protein, partial [Salmonella enterica]|uniref:hypothetical protein n=1 Tax=Salmonella enterica TaxID=28901 RepID=UPI003D265EE1
TRTSRLPRQSWDSKSAGASASGASKTASCHVASRFDIRRSLSFCVPGTRAARVRGLAGLRKQSRGKIPDSRASGPPSGNANEGSA